MACRCMVSETQSSQSHFHGASLLNTESVLHAILCQLLYCGCSLKTTTFILSTTSGTKLNNTQREHKAELHAIIDARFVIPHYTGA